MVSLNAESYLLFFNLGKTRPTLADVWLVAQKSTPPRMEVE